MWIAIVIIGILLMVNGVFQMQHAYVADKVARAAREESRGEMVCGAGNGLLALSSCQIWSSVDSGGNLGTARGMRSGLFRVAKPFELDLRGQNIRTMKPELLEIPGYAAASLKAVQIQYLKNSK